MAPTVPIDFAGQRESRTWWKRGGAGETMGKARKVSKGYSSGGGFVPDYRHVVETMAESEGFGSSGRVEMEITASEDSCAPKRKCINVNVDVYSGFSVPVRAMSVSKMSRPERKDLEMRLRHELEQVRILQRKIASFNSSNDAVTSPTSDIHSCSDGHERVVEGSVKQGLQQIGKKKNPTVRNGTHNKVAGSKRSEPVKRQLIEMDVSNVMLMKQCETLLNRMMSQDYSWIFNTPVDVVKLNIPDYFTIIKHPMDFGTVKTKLLSGEYSSPLGFAADVRLTLKNAMTYNPPGNTVHQMAKQLGKFFEMRWKPIEKKIPMNVEASLPARSSVIMETEAEAATIVQSSKKKKTMSLESKVKQEPVKQVMSGAEKLKLSTELEALLAELPENIIEFLKENSFNGNQTSEDEIEIDIDALSDDTLFRLRQLLDDYLLGKQKEETKAEPCKVELHNESRLSDSSVQPCKGNDHAEEDVDIGGNDPPLSSFPPVEIEKDTARMNSKCSTSSSSSSDSGSSSSDSDSRSSTGGESDIAKDSAPASRTMNTVSGEILEQKRADPLNGHAEGNSQPKLVSVEPNGDPEGESAPPERQVSPEKLYRAALLRSRFADTIIKAQEKTLEKGEKRDPEKLRLEMEELERRRREEKARLQAEAKAAEEARKNAEEEAAAEAKRKRELEREAARLALQKMEKTVEINENSQFLEDLEMFKSAAPDEELQSLTEETSPGHSQNCLGSFKFQANSNPLEQLGLYMKEDDEFEEENEPQSIPDASTDPEEGEID